MSRTRTLVGLIPALLIALAPRFAAAEDLSLERAVTRAGERNERARVAKERATASDARVRRARSFFFPDVTVLGTYTRRPEDTTFQKANALAATLQVSASLYDARAFPLYRQAKLERDAARLEAIDEVRLLGFEAATAYLATLGAEQVVKAAERRVAFAEDSLRDARARAAADLTSSNDVTKAELERATADRELTRARAEVATAYLELGYLIDEEVSGPLAEPAELLAAAAAAAPAGGEEAAADLLPGARARRLDLAAGRAHAAAAGAAAEEPARGFVPRLELLGQARASNEEAFSARELDWFVGLTLRWDIWDGGERAAETAEREALARAAGLAVTAGERTVALEVNEALVALARARASVTQADAVVTAARKNAAETAALYKQDLARALEVSDANARLFEAEVALSRERFGLGLAALDLRASLGFDAAGREVGR